MKSAEIRESFIRFFTERGHTFVKSAPIAPKDDPSLLFTNAGMNQFKNIFLGVSNGKNLKRAVNSQKCMRVSGKHNDLEEVGRDHHHHTFFEMLGNWSFGDYYKKEAIAWAWELLTRVWKLPREKLYVTVHTDDAEAEKWWRDTTDAIAGHIIRLKENFWEMGETGPCGSCSEIHIDRGPGHCVNEGKAGHACGVGAEQCGRFVELWNLVFMQNNREKDGTLKELPSKNIDTGMGFERVAAVLQGKRSNYDTDVFSPVITRLEGLSGRKYGHGDEGTPFRVIADHLRAITFAIADDVLPSNEGRGYVIRRLLRRAYRFGRKLGFREPFLCRLVQELVVTMGPAFPEIESRASFIEKIIETEEKSFERTLDRGLALFSEATAKLPAGGTIDGATLFKLYDTYGFPVDLTNQLAVENGFAIDQAGFDVEMGKQRERARASGKFKDMEGAKTDWLILSNGPSSVFTGYAGLNEDVVVRKIRKTGQGLALVTDKTPFYAESGGQTGDRGFFTDNNITIEITDTKPAGGEIIHYGTVEGDPDLSGLSAMQACVDEARRRDTARNHTATHLLHTALRKVLGDHAKQSGSAVDPDRLRFDYTHFTAPSEDELTEVERLCNEMVLLNIPVDTLETSLAEAEKMGATALFGEKYGDRVRVVRIGDKSMELCGGTHAAATGDIGYIQIASEGGVASGIRRIEAVTGRRFGEEVRKNMKILRSLARGFKTTADKVPDMVLALTERVKELEKEARELKAGNAMANADALIGAAQEVAGVRLVREHFKGYDRDTMQQKGEELMARLKQGVVVLLGEINGSAAVFTAISDDLVAGKGLHAGKLAQKLAELVGGKGGGKPGRAQAGGKNPAGLPAAFDQTPAILKSFLP